MLDKLLQDIMGSGERLTVEFKECRTKVNRDVYESICAFLNRQGGHMDQVKTEKANRPHGNGIINPADFTPYPKNPVIARFFKEIGRADELGSGVRNLYKFTRMYSGGADPQLIEADIFKIVIPLAFEATEQATEQATELHLDPEKMTAVIVFCHTARTAKEIMEFLDLKHSEHFRAEILKPLVAQKKLFLLFPDKPKSTNQKYYST